MIRGREKENVIESVNVQIPMKLLANAKRSEQGKSYIKMPYVKIFGRDADRQLYANVLFRSSKGVSVVFDQLIRMYMEQGMPEVEAFEKAKSVEKDFYQSLEAASAAGIPPVKIHIYPYTNKYEGNRTSRSKSISD